MDTVPARWANLAHWIDAMSEAIGRDDEGALRAAIARFDEARNGPLLGEIRRVAGGLQNALERFSLDSRLSQLAEREVPDAHHRLAHVLKLTDDAAHRTMDLVELCFPLAEQTGASASTLLHQWRGERGPPGSTTQLPGPLAVEAFLDQAVSNMSSVRNSLSEVLLAQGYQDISGQIIRGVMNLVAELESALGELLRLAGGAVPQAAPAAPANVRNLQGNGHGPLVPGLQAAGPAVSGQQDVDALLAALGM
jgi:chemotaxis protein CheZ